MRTKLGQNASYMAAQSARREVHLAGHLFSALARHEPLQHLSFARRELLDQIVRR
jgi:hypothetical protein